MNFIKAFNYSCALRRAILAFVCDEVLNVVQRLRRFCAIQSLCRVKHSL